MNKNELNYGNNNNVYRATTNFNTAIENPNVDIDRAIDVNIGENVDDINVSFNNNISSSFDNGINNNQSVYINTNIDMKQSNYNVVNDINNNDFSVVNEKVENSNVKYEPTLKKKKKPSDGLEIPKEVKAMMKIIFILLIFMFVVPYIYDFFRGLGLVITS